MCMVSFFSVILATTKFSTSFHRKTFLALKVIEIIFSKQDLYMTVLPNFYFKVSATLQDRRHADRWSTLAFLINPDKPYIF